MKIQGPLSTKRVRIASVSKVAALATLVMSCATTPKVLDTPMQKEKISIGDEPHLPDSYIGPGCGGTVIGSYRMCL